MTIDDNSLIFCYQKSQVYVDVKDDVDDDDDDPYKKYLEILAEKA